MSHKKVKINNLSQLPFAMEEAFSRLRINVGFTGSDVKKILVISSLPNEGKSFVTMHLWYQMASMGIPSVLVDMDLRKSVMMEKYDIQVDGGEKICGTSHYLSGNLSLEEAILHTDIEGGDIIPNTSNIINPAILVESARCREMLDELAEKYRYVFVDAPPLELVSDGERLASMCDGAILVVRGSSTSKRTVHNSIHQLQRSGCPVLGIVLNRTESPKKTYYHKYGSYGDGYYGEGYYGSSKNGK